MYMFFSKRTRIVLVNKIHYWLFRTCYNETTKQYMELSKHFCWLCITLRIQQNQKEFSILYIFFPSFNGLIMFLDVDQWDTNPTSKFFPVWRKFITLYQENMKASFSDTIKRNESFIHAIMKNVVKLILFLKCVDCYKFCEIFWCQNIWQYFFL